MTEENHEWGSTDALEELNWLLDCPVWFFKSLKCKNWYYQWFTPSHFLVGCIYYFPCFLLRSKPVHVLCFQIYWCVHEQCFLQCLVYSSKFASSLIQPEPMWFLWNIWHSVGHLWKSLLHIFLHLQGSYVCVIFKFYF